MKRVCKPKVVIRGWEDKPIKINKADDPFDDEDDKVKVGDMTVSSGSRPEPRKSVLLPGRITPTKSTIF